MEEITTESEKIKQYYEDLDRQRGEICKYRVYVGNLGSLTGDFEEIHRFFKKYAEITAICISMQKKDIGRFAFLYFLTDEDARYTAEKIKSLPYDNFVVLPGSLVSVTPDVNYIYYAYKRGEKKGVNVNP